MHNRNFFEKLRIPGHFPQKHMLETSISCFLPKTGQSERYASIPLRRGFPYNKPYYGPAPQFTLTACRESRKSEALITGRSASRASIG